MKIEALVQARMSSTRLPGKVLLPLGGLPSIVGQINRLKSSSFINQITVLTSTEPTDDILCSTLEAYNISYYRGSLNNVLERFVSYTTINTSDLYLRITGDCPLIDSKIIDSMIKSHIRIGADYSSNFIERKFPRGLDAEIITPSLFKKLGEKMEALSDFEKEHVTPFLYNNPNEYKINSYTQIIDYSNLRWTLDTKEDYHFLREIFDRNDEGLDLNFEQVLGLLASNPDLRNYDE